jgi:transcription initiation factor TFIIF subunit beta
MSNAWLVKVPKFLLVEWQTKKDKSELGTLIVNGKQGTLEIKHDELPLKYSLKLTNVKVDNMYSFNESGLQNKIVTECALQPEMGERYRNIMKKRRLNDNAPVKTKIGNRELKMTYLEDGFGKETKKGMRKDDEKRIRLPKKQVLDLLFRLFEKTEYASMKSLVEQTDQSASYLKEVLPEIAELIKRGPYNSMWTLQPQYKDLRK